MPRLKMDPSKIQYSHWIINNMRLFKIETRHSPGGNGKITKLLSEKPLS
jgi:hypothetical protein